MNDAELIAEARRAGAELRRRPGDLDRLAGALLAELADLAERLADRAPRLGGGDGAPGLGGHRRWHVNRGERNPDCRYCQAAESGARPPL